MLSTPVPQKTAFCKLLKLASAAARQYVKIGTHSVLMHLQDMKQGCSNQFCGALGRNLQNLQSKWNHSDFCIEGPWGKQPIVWWNLCVEAEIYY